MCQSTSWEGQLLIHHSPDIRPFLHHRDGGYEVGRLFSRHSLQHELFRLPVPHDPYGALYRKLVSADGCPNDIYPSLVRDPDTNFCQN